MKRLLSIILLLSAGSLPAQKMLSPDAAIQLALQKNFDVQVVRNNTAIAAAQNNIGAAGMSPTISLNANLGASSLNSYQEFNNGTNQDRPGASANSSGASVNLDWLIFDGGRMFAVKKRLNAGEAISLLQLKSQMESTIFDVVTAYYDAVRIQALIRAARQNLEIYEERLKLASMKLEIGSDSKVDMLLARTDANRARSTIIQLELDLMNAKSRLNTLLGRGEGETFDVQDTIVVNYDPAAEDLRKRAVEGNAGILLARKNEDAVLQAVREARASYLPFVTLNGAWLTNISRSQAGFILYNRQSGFNAGLTARWTIFNGGRNRGLVKERNLLYLNQRLQTEQVLLEVDALVAMQFRAMQLGKQMLELERQNMQDSRELQDISMERYRIGKSTLLETIETQRALEDSQVRYVNAQYSLKLAETQLLRVSGELVK